jgi:hypothetical protein
MDFGKITRMKSTSTIIENVNALKATGPRTLEGKAASSRNSLKHGLTATQVVIPGENQADFDRLLADLAADRKPDGELEIQTLGEIAACTWRLARARAREGVALTVSNELFRMGATPGITAAFDRVVRYMGSIERQLNRATIRLQQLQAERRKHPQPAEKPKVMAAGASNSATYAPPEFVSSNAENRPAPPVAISENVAATPEITAFESPEAGRTGLRR